MAMRSIDRDGDQAGVPIAEAAAALGITAEAVRTRIRRGQLRAYKSGSRWRVVLPLNRSVTGLVVPVRPVQEQVIEQVVEQGNEPVMNRSADRFEVELAALRAKVESQEAELNRAWATIDGLVAALAQRQAEPLGTPPAPPPAPLPTHRLAQPPGLIAQWLRRLFG
jgi:excisionase family DNA binding protein